MLSLDMARKTSRALWKDKLEGKPVSASKLSKQSFGNKKYLGTILGIDPSLRGTGIAVVEFQAQKQPLLLHSETVKLPAKIQMPDCLGEIHQAVARILDTYEIDTVALEQTIYVQNFQTAQVLGAARGAAIAAAAVAKMPVYEYPPLRVKQAIVGLGRASKVQVSKTVRSLLGLGDVLKHDESDAAAVALCHAYTATE